MLCKINKNTIFREDSNIIFVFINVTERTVEGGTDLCTLLQLVIIDSKGEWSKCARGHPLVMYFFVKKVGCIRHIYYSAKVCITRPHGYRSSLEMLHTIYR